MNDLEKQRVFTDYYRNRISSWIEKYGMIVNEEQFKRFRDRDHDLLFYAETELDLYIGYKLRLQEE